MNNPAPIFIGWTRSFWFGITPALLVLLDLIVAASSEETVGPIAALLSWLFGWSIEGTEAVMRGVASVAALIVAHQRRGQNRPYTRDPRAIQ